MTGGSAARLGAGSPGLPLAAGSAGRGVVDGVRSACLGAGAAPLTAGATVCSAEIGCFSCEEAAPDAAGGVLGLLGVSTVFASLAPVDTFSSTIASDLLEAAGLTGTEGEGGSSAGSGGCSGAGPVVVFSLTGAGAGPGSALAAGVRPRESRLRIFRVGGGTTGPAGGAD